MRKIFICTWTIIMIIFTVSCGKDESRSGHVKIRLFSENSSSDGRIKNVKIETIHGWKNIKPVNNKDNPMVVTVNESGFGIKWTYDDVSYDTNGIPMLSNLRRVEYYEAYLTATTSKKDFAIVYTPIKLGELKDKENYIRRYDSFNTNIHDFDKEWMVASKETNIVAGDFSYLKINYNEKITPIELDVPYLVSINEKNIDTPYSEESEFFYEIKGGNVLKYFEVVNSELLKKNPIGINKDKKIRFKDEKGQVVEIDIVDDLALKANKKYNLTINIDKTFVLEEIN